MARAAGSGATSSKWGADGSEIRVGQGLLVNKFLQSEEQLIVRTDPAVRMFGARVPLEVLPQRQVDGTYVLRVRGEVDLSNRNLFEQPLRELLDDSVRRVIVDLSECDFIDSSGLAALLAAHKKLAANGSGAARLLISGARGQVRRMLEMTGISAAIPILSVHEPIARAP